MYDTPSNLDHEIYTKMEEIMREIRAVRWVAVVDCEDSRPPPSMTSFLDLVDVLVISHRAMYALAKEGIAKYGRV